MSLKRINKVREGVRVSSFCAQWRQRCLKEPATTEAGERFRRFLWVDVETNGKYDGIELCGFHYEMKGKQGSRE